MTPTPLQRLSEIVEAGTQGDWTFERSDRRGAWIGADGSWSALTCGNTDTEATANGTLIVSAVRLARFLCSPEAVEVLAGIIADERLAGQHSKLIAVSLINTIAEQALKEPSNG